MRKPLISIAAAALLASPALAADLQVPAAQQAGSWDIAFGSAVTSDYIWRGVTQSNHRPSVNAYFEPRWKPDANNELYIGIAGNSISFPNRAAAEIDLYGGWRPTIGKLAFDFGGWFYWYPGGQCFNTPALCGVAGATPLPINGNVVTADVSFWEIYAKATYNVTDAFAVGFAYYYSPSVLKTGAPGHYVVGNAKYTFQPFANGITPYLSGEIGYWNLGTTDAFYGIPVGMPGGAPYADYAHWDIGVGFVWKTFTLDLRYSDTNLSPGNCNAFTSDQTALSTGFVTPINPAPGFGSSWCGSRFFATLKADLTMLQNLR